MATRVSELELTHGIQPIDTVDGYDNVHILVRYRSRPIGWATIPLERGESALSADRIQVAITDQLGATLLPYLFGAPEDCHSGPRTALPAISVIVCTRDRTDLLQSCLRALLAQEYAEYEVIVVDNAPASDETARLVMDLPVRYIREDRPGLDWARNRGIREARHPVIAFIDDDAQADSGWLGALGSVFATADADAVTGSVAPAELVTDSQIRFELQYGGMGHGFTRRVFKKPALTTDDVLWASGYGVGTNMAFRRELFANIGLFDTALDVGTPSAGGGDVDMFHRVVAHGYTLIYEPAALVWHLHRGSAAAFRRQVFNNGTSFGAYLITCARNRTVSWTEIAVFFARCWVKWWLLRRLVHPHGFPRHLILLEVCGTLASPFAYALAHRRRRAVAGIDNSLVSIAPSSANA